MKNFSDFLLLLVVIALLMPSSITSAVSIDTYDYRMAEGMVAMQSANTDFSSATLPSDSVIPNPLCGCNGTGFVKSGDGIIDIPCVCGADCKCKKTGQVGVVGAAPVIDITKDVYICYYFSAAWCVPCRQFKTYDMPMLTKAGFKFVEDNFVKGANVVTIDIDKNPAKFLELRDEASPFIPTFVIVKNGKVIGKKQVGYANFKAFGDWYNSTITEDRAKK